MRISDWSSDVCSSDLTAQARRRRGLTARQAFILTTSSWILIPAVGALPLSFGGLDLSYTDAFFEAMSGITTTGATVIVGLDNAPPGVLLWRALLQWLGGIGVIAMAIRSEEHTSELQSLQRISYAVFCLKQQKNME